MRLLILSDLHLELEAPLKLPPDVEYDVVLLAGDIHNPGRKAVEWAQREDTFGRKPVVLVPGNHEFYGCVMHAELEKMRNAAKGSNVHVLARDVLVLAGLRIVGCTLWTDFQLGIKQPDGSVLANVERSLGTASGSMNDFRCIELHATMKSQYRERQLHRLLRAEDTLAMHWIDRDWLSRVLAPPFDGPTVVVTHHAPSKGSVAAKYADDWLTPAFASDLPPDFFSVPTLWVHGHTHTEFDYEQNGCRIVSNPRGYPMKDGSFENPLFNAGMVVEIPLPSLQR